MKDQSRKYATKTALKLGGIILVTYTVMGIGMSAFSLAMLLIDHIFLHGSRAAGLLFISALSIVCFVIFGTIQASIFLFKWYFNKLPK